MLPFDPRIPKTRTKIQPPPQAATDWPQLLEQWKQARRPPSLSSVYHAPVGSMVAASIGTFVVLMSTMVFSVEGSTLSAAVLTMLMIFGVFLMLSLAWNDPPLTHAQSTIEQQMRVLTDTRAIGPLLDLLPDAATRRERDVLQTTLTRLLPLLRPDNAALSDAQQKILYDAITTRTAEHHNAFFLACMDAVAQIGDVNALVPLTRVIIEDAPTHAQQAARDKARQTRDTLLARLDFGTVAAIPAWLDQLPAPALVASGASSFFHLDKMAVPMYALSRLLPRLTPADTSLLTPRNRHTLTWAHRMILSMFVIQSGRGGAMGLDAAKIGRLGPNFELAVLDALAQIGTGDDAAHVQTLINDGSTDYNRAVRAKAREVLPLLEARREKEQAGRTLLRGATAPPTAQDQLLRAASDAHNTQDTRPDELLRVPAPNAPPAVLPTQATEEPTRMAQNQSQ